MTLRTKVLILAILAIALPLVAWSVTFVYWHITITRALRTIETDEKDEHIKAIMTLYSAGCRGLPYAVAEATGETKPEFLSSLTFFIAWQTVYPGTPPDESSSEVLAQRLDEWAVDSRDSAERRRQKCEAIRGWWKEHGSEHHQTWRVWTSACRGIRPEAGRR